MEKCLPATRPCTLAVTPYAQGGGCGGRRGERPERKEGEATGRAEGGTGTGDDGVLNGNQALYPRSHALWTGGWAEAPTPQGQERRQLARVHEALGCSIAIRTCTLAVTPWVWMQDVVWTGAAKGEGDDRRGVGGHLQSGSAPLQSRPAYRVWVDRGKCEAVITTFFNTPHTPHPTPPSHLSQISAFPSLAALSCLTTLDTAPPALL